MQRCHPPAHARTSFHHLGRSVTIASLAALAHLNAAHISSTRKHSLAHCIARNGVGNKAWSGLVKEFYYQRYSIYADMLLEAHGKPVDKAAYASSVMRLACEFGHNTGQGEFPAAPVGDAFAIASELWSKYPPSADSHA